MRGLLTCGAAFLALSCSGGGDGGPTDPGGGTTTTPVTPTPVGDAGYTVTTIDPPAGYSAASANAVNDAAVIAGTATAVGNNTTFAQRAYVRIGSTDVLLTSGPTLSGASAISNGSTLYVAGSADTAARPSDAVPVRWTLNSSGAPEMKVLENAPGGARGVNDNGDAIGFAGLEAVIWLANGSRIAVTPPSPYTRGNGRDINNAGHAVITFAGTFSRGFLRLQSGELIELPPPAGDVMSFVTGISEVNNGAVYISGVSSDQNVERFRAVRWTVNIASRAVTVSTPLAYDSEARGVSNDGTAPVHVVFQSTDWPQLWGATSLFTLRNPPGPTNVLVSAISPNGRFVTAMTNDGFFGTVIVWSKP